MKLRFKTTLLVLSTGIVALNTGTCLFRFLGDFVGDSFVLNAIQ